MRQAYDYWQDQPGSCPSPNQGRTTTTLPGDGPAFCTDWTPKANQPNTSRPRRDRPQLPPQPTKHPVLSPRPSRESSRASPSMRKNTLSLKTKEPFRRAARRASHRPARAQSRSKEPPSAKRPRVIAYISSYACASRIRTSPPSSRPPPKGDARFARPHCWSPASLAHSSLSSKPAAARSSNRPQSTGALCLSSRYFARAPSSSKSRSPSPWARPPRAFRRNDSLGGSDCSLP